MNCSRKRKSINTAIIITNLTLTFILHTLVWPALSQGVEIAGYVHSAANTPISPANVVIKGTSQGTVTDSNVPSRFFWFREDRKTPRKNDRS